VTESAVKTDLHELWEEQSPLIQTIQEGIDIKRVARKCWGDPAGRITLGKLKMWRRVLEAILTDNIEDSTQDREAIHFYLDTIQGLIGTK
jgi:hypothetical protein